MTQAAFVYDDQLSRHVLRHDHPMRPHRLRLTYELVAAYDLLAHPDALLHPPREATLEELQTIHTPAYIAAVQSISRGEGKVNPSAYNFIPEGDNPPYRGMYEAAVLSTGASLTAMDLVLTGRVPVAFNISGGLHHALPGAASGFCIFNDPAIVIACLVGRGLRVAYLDIDAHHGDGVQAAFYDTDQVLTISTHESGRWLFPGTGEVRELGTGAGRGYSVNVPLAPFTGDEVYLWAFHAVVPPLVDRFRPDVLVAQLGVDAHNGDPLAHLKLTTRSYDAVVRWAKGLGVPWIALGGGGYNLEAVPRVWALEYGIMLGVDLADTVPAAYQERYGSGALRDPEVPEPAAEDREFVRTFAEATVAAIRQDIFPYHGLAR
ncbi:MAG: acetoin utilization protein AcuC [Chloroflexi bacterium]|nr:acetoin utilization protein AcuC [Chloroflexota bacterium]